MSAGPPAEASGDPLAVLRDPATIRARCAAITQAVGEGLSDHFRLDRDQFDEAAERVAALTRNRFPDLRIPPHSRWRHFAAGGVDRLAELDALLAGRSPSDVARARIDLTVVSVLLDAGAGPGWRYREGTGETYSRSEGLAVASLRAFVAGVFSDATTDPLRVDARALQRIDADTLRSVFQVGSSNPLVGLEGRAALLAHLGRVLEAQARHAGGDARPGRLFDAVMPAPGTTSDAGAPPCGPSASQLLTALVRDYAPIWRSGSTVLGLPAGDVWPHRHAGAAVGADADPDRATSGWVPFHKLSQWLAYSLLEPFEWAGAPVTGIEALTGLPEYRNGGLLLDSGVIVPQRPSDLARTWKPSDEFVIEWRALTVTLLDELAARVRRRLGVDAAQLPLACVLEGGTWAAGRQIAQERRGGTPPFPIDSDGTVF
jgi:hypothetical protein